MLQLTATDHQQGLRVALSGQFTFSDNQAFKQIFELMDRDSIQFLEVNFAGVDFIDSTGLGMLLLLRNFCEEKHIAMSIHSAQGQVEKVFMISKFDQLFSLHP